MSSFILSSFKRSISILALWPVLGLAASVQEQAPANPATRGMYNWIHSTADAERAYDFYRDVFDFELAHSTFNDSVKPGTQPPPIRTPAQAASDPLVWDLTNTHGSRFRTVFMEARNLPFGHELSEFFDISRIHRPANPWDTGASSLILYVSDFDTVLARLIDQEVPVITVDGKVVETGVGRTILVRDPDGYLVQVIEASQVIPDLGSEEMVVWVALRIAVADTTDSLAFYHDLLGFDVGEERELSEAELSVFGLIAGNATQTVMTIPGIDVDVLLTEFGLPPDTEITVHDYQWQLQDVGAPQFQLQVSGLDALLQATRERGYRFLSVDGNPISRPFGRFVFVIDPDGVLVEYVEPRSD